MRKGIVVHFFGKSSRLNRRNLVSIYLRLTIDGKQLEVATYHHVQASRVVFRKSKSKGKLIPLLKLIVHLTNLLKKYTTTRAVSERTKDISL